jgi:hypothetical protein
LDEDQRRRVTKLVKSSASILASGALMVVTDSRCRLRRLPLKDQNA